MIMLKIQNKHLNKNIESYQYCYGQDFLEEKQAKDILNWLKTANWDLTVADFYTQYEFMLNIKNTDKDLHYLFSKETLNYLKDFMKNLFNVDFKDNCYVVAHKLIDGHYIDIHNDYLENEPDVETHRLIIQFNDGWAKSFGGLLKTFNSDNKSDIKDIFIPNHNSVFAFEISPYSYHAVSPIHNATRYTLIYNFTKLVTYEN
ncbi:cyclophane-containing peptide 2OG-Fe(II) oxygenase YhhC [Moraxella oblonga]|uniref:cyclophane-containing peptide 2OG-Fe(II) oxygenase YhhC n=1 Tax=Moraxella oblonga TaxID=200413 RepID=UPI000829D001|nr:cyclophane-containing peptide 2OG-Fe(II) oxygenase YhhC [Moraxella oblonga]